MRHFITSLLVSSSQHHLKMQVRQPPAQERSMVLNLIKFAFNHGLLDAEILQAHMILFRFTRLPHKQCAAATQAVIFHLPIHPIPSFHSCSLVAHWTPLISSPCVPVPTIAIVTHSGPHSAVPWIFLCAGVALSPGMRLPANKIQAIRGSSGGTSMRSHLAGVVWQRGFRCLSLAAVFNG